MTENNNPLNKYFRQPAIYISLPSGASYPPHVVTPTATGEFAVMPMTARDEIKFKTPDALMNGQGVVDVIQSCIPDIKDAWQVKSTDLDSILIAIRIATYGETMDITFDVPGIKEKASHTLNLPALLDEIRNDKMQETLVMKDGLEFTLNPLTYRDMTQASLQTFQQQRIYSSVASSELADEEKSKRFNESFRVLTELNDKILQSNVNKIKTPEGTETSDPAQIKEFFENANTAIVNELQDKLEVIRKAGTVKPLKIKATDEQIKAGAPATYEVPVTFDTANFFV